MPVIDTSSSGVENIFYHRWGGVQPSIRSFYPFTYTAGCNLEFTYVAMIRIDENTLMDLPFAEINFYPNLNQVLVRKCEPGSSIVDPECNGAVTPYFKKYTICIMGTLNDMDSTMAYTEFDVTIGPNCDDDMVTFSATVQDQVPMPYRLGIN